MLLDMFAVFVQQKLRLNNGVFTQSRRVPWTAEVWTGHVRKNHIPVDDVVLVAITIL